MSCTLDERPPLAGLILLLSSIFVVLLIVCLVNSCSTNELESIDYFDSKPIANSEHVAARE